MVNKLTIRDELTEFLLYTTADGKVKVEIYFHNENIWLTQKRMAELFGVQRPSITRHLKNIFVAGELEENSVCSILEHTAEDGKKYNTKYYNLDAIISVGYRVNSTQATRFRIWATERLKEYMLKGFILDDERLKNGRFFGRDYFRELLERVRSIRASKTSLKTGPLLPWRNLLKSLINFSALMSIGYYPVREKFPMIRPWEKLGLNLILIVN